MLKVTIDDSNDSVRVREGEKDGRKWRMVSQRIWVHRHGQAYPEKMEITLPNDINPYSPGDYSLDLDEYVSRGAYDALTLNTRDGIRLKPYSLPTPESEKKPLFNK